MSVIGKGSSSFRKKDVMEQKGIALGFKKIRFAHKATAGDTGINMNALVQPSEMAAYGFTNPTATAIAGANLFTYRSNLKLVSSLRGLLVDQLSYVVNSSTQISFIDFTAEDGEIFTGWIDDSPTTSLSVVDGNQIVASGILLAGQTDFNIGTPIEINKNPASQMGAIMVFADRGLQYRKVGNITSGDGDYIEVPVAGGLGSLIRFNASGSDRLITVVSNGVVAERPDGSMMAAIERVQGQVDAMVPTLAQVAGVPESTFQTGPNNVDLKQFGDAVSANTIKNTQQDARLTTLETVIPEIYSNVSGIGATTVSANVGVDVPGAAINLVAGVEYEFGFNMLALFQINGSTGGAYGLIDILDPAGNLVDRMQSLYLFYPLGTGVRYNYFQAVNSTRFKPTISGTYKARIKCDNAAVNATFGIAAAGGATTGGLSPLSATSYIYARRVK